MDNLLLDRENRDLKKGDWAPFLNDLQLVVASHAKLASITGTKLWDELRDDIQHAKSVTSKRILIRSIRNMRIC